MKLQIKQLRKKNGLTQIELAKKIGVSSSTIAMYEVGEREPSIETLDKMCEVFNVDMDTLCGRTSAKKPIENDELSKEMKMMIDLFSQLPPESQEKAIPLIEAALRAVGLLQ